MFWREDVFAGGAREFVCADFCAGFFGRRSAEKIAGPCKEIREKIVAQTANPSQYYSCSSCRTAARLKDSLLVKFVGAVRPTPSPFLLAT